MLPDVDEQSARDWQSEQFSDDIDRRLRAWQFEHDANARIADLGATPPPPPPPEPPPEPPPSGPPLSNWADQVWQQGVGAVQAAGGNAQQFGSDLYQRLQAGGQSAEDAFTHGLSAASAAGADLQQFADRFNPAPPPPPPRPSVQAGPPLQQIPPDLLQQPLAMPGAPLPAVAGLPSPEAPTTIGQGKQPFIQSIAPLAMAASQQTGIDPSVYVAIAANETGWGASKTAQQQNNLFSIQGPSGGASRWATYQSPQAAFNAFNDLISSTPRYAKAWADRADPIQFINDLRSAGYVVDEPGFPAQGWVDNVTSITRDMQSTIPDMAAKGQLPPAPVVQHPLEEPPTQPSAIADTVPVDKNWKTSFDFGQTYTGNYRTGTPHRGIDLIPSGGQGIGYPVTAFVPGTVTNIFRDPGGAGGLIVYTQDKNGLTDAYMHLDSTASGLKVGDQVQRGDVIARMGESGTEGAPHLHFEVRKNAATGDPTNQLIDPRPYLNGTSPDVFGSQQPGGILGMLGSALGGAQQAVSGAAQGAQQALGGFAQGAQDLLQGAQQQAQQILQDAQQQAQAVIQQAQSLQAPVIQASLPSNQDIQQAVQQAVSGTTQTAQNAVSSAAQGVQQAVQDVQQAYLQAPQTASAALGNLQQAASTLQQQVQSAPEVIQANLQSRYETPEMRQAQPSGLEQVQTALPQLANLPQQAVSNLISAYAAPEINQPLFPGGQSAAGALINQLAEALPELPATPVPGADTGLGKVIRGQPIGTLNPLEQAQALMQWNQLASQANYQAARALNPLSDVRLLGEFISQAANPENYLALGALGGPARLAAGAVGGGIPGILARGATYGGPLTGLIAAQQPGATAQDIAIATALGAPLGAATGGLLEVGLPGAARYTRQLLENPDVQAALATRQVAGGRPFDIFGQSPAPWDPNTSPDPAIRAVARMMAEQQVPEVPQGSLLQQFVRGITNRFESADRFQRDALRQAGLDLSNPPEGYDLSAYLRQQNGDAAAALRADRDLGPIIRSVGNEQPALQQYLIHNNNIDVARAVGDAVQAEAADRAVASNLTDALNNARTSLRMRQQVLGQLENASVPDEARIAAQRRQVQGAQRSVANRQAAVDAAQQQILAEAAQAGADAMNNRVFSGGLRMAYSVRALQSMENDLGPQRMTPLRAVANQVYDYLGGLRQTMVDSGLVSPETAQLWERRYPHYVPTNILDYAHEGEAAGGYRPGTRISLADNGVRNYGVEGTARFRENPLAAIHDLTHRVETKARRNQVANALINLDQLRPEAERSLQLTDRPATGNEPIVHRINNGVVERYLAVPQMAAAVNGHPIVQAPGFVRHWTNFLRGMYTVSSPAFALLRNPSIDFPEYLTTEIANAGGNPLVLPKLMARLFSSYGDAFQGILQGEFRGPVSQRYVAGGGLTGMQVERTVASRAEALRALSAPRLEFMGGPGPFKVPTPESLQAVGGHAINSVGDLNQLVRQLTAMQPVLGPLRLPAPLVGAAKAGFGAVHAVAERAEMAPRLASMTLGEERGLTPARAVLAGQNVTLNFNEGGTLSKTLNSFIPFFNAAVQGSNKMALLFKNNPRGALASTVLTVGLPAVLAEAWNNSDPQRAEDYANVPQYLKDQGVVIMYPGEAPVDAQGNRKPQFQWINMRGFAPFSRLARAAAHQALESTVGTPTPSDWQAATRSMIFGLAPIRAGQFSDIPGAFQPQFVPGMGTGLQLMLNRDIFRNRDIATIRNDVQASQASREIADALTHTVRTLNPGAEVRPSQVEFAVHDLLGGVGSTLLGARQFLPGAEAIQGTEPQRQPVLGGALTALGVRGSTGELGTQARANTITDDSRRYLQSQGVEWAPSPVQPNIGKLTLNAAEETRYQILTNRYTEALLQDLRRGRDLEGEPQDIKLRIVQRVVQGARRMAEADIVDSLPPAEVNRRIDQQLAAEAAGTTRWVPSVSAPTP